MAILQKSDFINPTASNPATLAEITFDDWIKQICEIFNADWFIDGDGFLRIEHVSWFNRIVTKDTTTGRNALMNKNKRLFRFTRERIPVREQYNFMEQGNIDFVGKDIIYPPSCPDENLTNRHDVGSITTDTTFIQNNPTEISETGFVLIVRNPDDLSLIDQEVGVLTGLMHNNAHLSWANLHEAYHRHRRPLIEGNMNGADTEFVSAIPTKIQENVKYIGCCEDIQPRTDLIISALGNGEIAKVEKTNSDELFTFDLLF
jgi:hypothetical protein